MIFINQNIKDIYVDVISDAFLKHVFPKCSIKKRDDTNQTITLNVSYNKNILDAYNNELLNLLRNMCLIDKIIMNVEQKIIPCEESFFICYLFKVQNSHELPLLPFLDKLRAVFVADVRQIAEDRSSYNIVKIEIDYDLDFHKGIEGLVNPDHVKHGNTDMKPFTYDDMTALYKKNRVHFFTSDYDMSKDIVVNFLNMLLRNCIKYAYMKKVCKYYAKKNVTMWSYEKA